MRGLVDLFGRRPSYSAVRQNDPPQQPPITGSGENLGGGVYNTTTTRRTSLNPTQAVFDKFFKGKFAENQQKRKWVLMTMVCGLCAISIGALTALINPYEIVFKMKVIFSEGSETFLMWQKPEIQLYLKVYLFNVTNREAFLTGEEEKLRFQEVGPYVYREDLEHANVTFLENGTMFAIPKHPLTFVPELSSGIEEDILVLPNIALLSFANLMSTASFFPRMGVNVLIKQTNTQPLVDMTAKEFMFGYKSTLVSLGNKFMPSWIHFDKLGLIDRMYDFDGDTSTVYSGATNYHLSGLLERYNGLNYLPQWDYPCNNLTGSSDGTKFNSRIGKEESLMFFRKSLCRSVNLDKVGEEMIYGIPGYRYNFRENSFDNGEVDKQNMCFCGRKKCLPAGLLDVQSCYYGFPIALSYPHFYKSDKRLGEAVEGMTPDKEKHTTFFIINEESGLPLNLSVKMQINMALGDLSLMANSRNFSHMILPMLWTDITLPELPPDMKTKFFIYLRVGPIMQTLSIYLFSIGGTAFILLSIASALVIPRLSLVSSQRNNDTSWKPDDTSNKRRNSTSKQTHSKEMELYYCSLLASSGEARDENEQDDSDLRKLTFVQEVDI